MRWVSSQGGDLVGVVEVVELAAVVEESTDRALGGLTCGGTVGTLGIVGRIDSPPLLLILGRGTSRAVSCETLRANSSGRLGMFPDECRLTAGGSVRGKGALCGAGGGRSAPEAECRLRSWEEE